jgi:hypothetical protein
MKNVFKVLWIIALVAIIGFSFASCGGGGGGGPAPATPANPTSAVFESKDSAGNIFILEVSSASASRAAYTPKNGDSFTLTIITSAGETWTDSGSVSTSGTTLTLSGTKASALSITVSGNNMTKIEVPSGTTITIEGTNITTVTLTAIQQAIPTVFTLNADKWSDDESDWNRRMDLSEITSVKPKKDNRIRFRIRGTTDKALENLALQLDSYPSDWSDYQFLGCSESIKIPAGDFNKTFEFQILDNPKTGYTVAIGLYNFIAVPASVKHGAVMATISNFEIKCIGLNLPN